MLDLREFVHVFDIKMIKFLRNLTLDEMRSVSYQ